MKKFIGIVVALAIVLAMLPVTALAAINYYVAGVPELCTSSWEPGDANNIMIPDGDVYTKTYSNVPVGNYEFKITDGTWSNSWGDGTSNYKFAVTTKGDITITFNPSTKAIAVTGTGVGEAKMEINYITAVGTGSGAFLNGVSWDPAASSNKMTENNGVYSISYENVAAGTYKYKFAANGAWTDDWGTGAATESGVTYDAAYKGGDSSLTVAEDGSTVTLTLDLSGIDNKGNGAKIIATVTAPVVEVEPAVYELVDGVMQSITIPAGGSAIVKVDATASDMSLTVNGNRMYWDWSVQAGVQSINPGPSGAVETPLPAGSVHSVTINNKSGEAEQVLDVTASSPKAGTSDNPAELVMGENVSTTGRWEAYFYTYTPSEDGKLTLSINTAKSSNWSLYAEWVKNGIPFSTDMLYSDSTPVVSVLTVDVTAGMEYKVIVGSADGEGSTVYLDASFTAGSVGGEGGEGGGDPIVPEGNVLVSVTDESVGANAPWTYTFTAETTGTLKVQNSEGVCYKIFGLEGPESESLRYTSSKFSAGTEAEYRVEVPGEITVKVWAYDYGEVDGKISCTLTFTPDEGEQEVQKEEYVLSDTMVFIGENTLTLNPDAIFTIFEFCPDEAGVYKFSVNNAMACVGYSGAGSFFYYAPSGELINSFEYTLENEGPSIMVGISDVEGEFTLTIERLGDAVRKEVVWVEFENEELEGVADFEFDGEVIALDVTDPELSDKIFFGIDGLFRYGSPTGPVIVSMVAENDYVSISDLLFNGPMRLPELDEEGDLIGGTDISNAMTEYLEAGNVPMTFELMMMLYAYGSREGIGWYNADQMGYYLFAEEVDPEIAYLCFFGYAEGTEVAADEYGTVFEGDVEFETDDDAWYGEEIILYPAEDGVMTIEILSSNPGHMVYVYCDNYVARYMDMSTRIFTGEGEGVYTIDVKAGCVYTVYISSAAYDEETEEYVEKAGSVSYVVTYDEEGKQVDDETPDYFVTGEGDLFGNWDAANPNGGMTESADGVYKFTLNNVPAGNYKFKITNGTWDKNWGDPNSGDPDGNYLLTVESAGDVTITFNSVTGEISVAVNGEDIPKTGDMSVAAIAFALMAATAGAVVIGKKKEF